VAWKKRRFTPPAATVSRSHIVPSAAIESVLERPQPMADEAVIGRADIPFGAKQRTM
jgi:hypothetical protein